MQRLQASYAAIPPGAPVRLAKRTSNLFRPAARRSASRVSTSPASTGVIAVDPVARTADVQGMCTYEDLVDATLPHGLIPLVVPQLRTITLGGAVTGLGIESTSLPQRAAARVGARDGRPHRRRARSSPPGPASDLFDAFPNSYGSLGYATRLRIELEPVPAYVAPRHVRFDDAGAARQGGRRDHRDAGEHDGSGSSGRGAAATYAGTGSSSIRGRVA